MKKFLLFLMAMGLFAIAGCSSSTDSNTTDPGDGNKGECKNPVLSEIDLTGNPFSLLGIYEVEAYGKNGEPTDTPSQKSELRVGLNLNNTTSGGPEVLMSLDFEGKKMIFDKHTIDLSNAGADLPTFISKTFEGLGAELIENDKYGLFFKLDPATNKQYKAIIDNAIVSEGQYLKLKLKKIQDIEVDKGFDGSCSQQPNKPENPDNPSGPVEVTGIKITTEDRTYYKGSDVTIEFTLTPANTTQTKVNYSSTNNGNGEIVATNGKGSLVLKGVQQDDTITFTTENNQTDTYNIKVTDSVDRIDFPKGPFVLEQGKNQQISIDGYDHIKDKIESITYSSKENSGKIQVESAGTGATVTALKNGVETLVATVILLDKKELTAEVEIEVLGHIDYNDETSLEGTYDLIFFGTKSNGDSMTDAVIQTNCDIYKSLWGVNSCPSSGTMNGNCQIRNNEFAGRAIIKVVNGNLRVHTKVAMLYTDMGSIGQGQATNDRYQYSIFADRSLSDWKDTNLTSDITGRNVNSKITLSNSKYYFEENKKYTGQNKLDIVLFYHFDGKKVSAPIIGEKIVNPDTRLILRKISSKIVVNDSTMDPNSFSKAPFDKLGSKIELDKNGNITAPIE